MLIYQELYGVHYSLRTLDVDFAVHLAHPQKRMRADLERVITDLGFIDFVAAEEVQKFTAGGYEIEFMAHRPGGKEIGALAIREWNIKAMPLPFIRILTDFTETAMGNKDLALFHIDRHRSAKVAKTLLGENFEGTLVRDRYAADNGIGTDWQSCIAHILRNAKEIRAEHDLLPKTEKDNATGPFCDRVRNLGARLCDLSHKLLSGHLSWKTAPRMEKAFVRELNQTCKPPLRFKPAENLCTFLAGPNQKSLFTFLRRPGVPPTNKHAEQSLRHLVIFRKIYFGTRSDTGLKTHSILPSLVQTARRQGVHPRPFFQTLLTADPSSAQAALYSNSS